MIDDKTAAALEHHAAEQAKAYVRAGFPAREALAHVSMRGVPAYLVTNAAANVRRIKQRIADLEAKAVAEGEETEE